MLTAFFVSVGTVLLFVVPTDAISCYKYYCGISTDSNSYYKFNESCVDPFSTTGKAKCNGTQCLTQWWFSWDVKNSVNQTTSSVSRVCMNTGDASPLPISTLNDCEGISEKYTLYKDKKFFVYENQCCYQTYYNYVDHGDSYTHCFCLTDNCNDKAYKPSVDNKPSANALGTFYQMMILMIAVALVVLLIAAKLLRKSLNFCGLRRYKWRRRDGYLSSASYNFQPKLLTKFALDRSYNNIL